MQGLLSASIGNLSSIAAEIWDEEYRGTQLVFRYLGDSRSISVQAIDLSRFVYWENYTEV